MAATAIPRALRTGPHEAAHRRRTTARIPAPTWRDAGWTGTAPGGSSARSRAAPGSPNPSDRTRSDTFITAALDAGVPLRDVQEAASHADPRTTIRYDRARGSLDRHATYIVAAYIAGATR